MSNLIGFENGQVKDYTQETNQMTVMDTTEVNGLLISNVKEEIDGEAQNLLTVQNFKKGVTQQIRLTDKTLEIFSQFILALQGELDLSDILQVFPKEDQVVIDLNDYYKNQCNLDFIVNHTANILPKEIKERVAQLITYMVNKSPEKKLDISDFWRNEEVEFISAYIKNQEVIIKEKDYRSFFDAEDYIQKELIESYKEEPISFWIDLLKHVHSKFKEIK